MLMRPTNSRWHLIVLVCLTLAMILPGLAALPVIDRDEARFAQASVQMADTNDLLNIRFQDEARNKKPAAAYWAQTAMIKVFAKDNERRIWAQRLPSLFAALLAIIALYWGGSRMIGRDAAFIAAALLAVSAIFVFEGHIAKTDAMLCASTTVMLACLGRLRAGGEKLGPQAREVWIFWIALGLSIMIKGPIGPVIAATCLGSLLLWEKSFSWARPLLNWPAILLFVLTWLPWAIAMYLVTDGAFFAESLGNDFGSKVTSGQEGHGAPPGVQTLMIWLALWPANLFLLPALIFAVMTAKSRPYSRLSRAMRLFICWALPFWIFIEIMPTKLPHYGLPIFPALCLMMGASVMAMIRNPRFAKARIIGGLLFFVSSSVLIGAVIYIQLENGEANKTILTLIFAAGAGMAAVAALAALWGNKIRAAFAAVLLTALVFFTGTYRVILPNIPQFQTSERMVAALKLFAPDIQSGQIHSPHYPEPSLVYHFGQDIDVTERPIDISDGSVVILNSRRTDAEEIRQNLSRDARTRGLCLQSSAPTAGFNYSKGTPLSLVILREAPC